MLINDILFSKDFGQFEPIKENCHQFLSEAGGVPMVKFLPKDYDNFQKVKLRKRKKAGKFAETFNEAFEHEMSQLRERSLFANGEIYLETIHNTDKSIEPFYVFPIDGYDFIYSQKVKNSDEKYSIIFNEIFNQLGERSTEEVFSDLLKFTYTSQDLQEGLKSGAEIIMYGIPYYYAVRKSYVNDYEEILTLLH
jgi:hypothetical protein